jgi:ribonuclease P/MRP protein subunit RPP1
MGVVKRSRFFDLNVHSLPDYADSPGRMVLEAKELAYSGICLTSFNPSNSFHDHDISSYLYEDFEIYNGIEIEVNSVSGLNKQVNRLRGNASIILASGGHEKINRAALENQKIDVLTHPASGGKPLNHVLTKAAADNGVAIDFNIGALTMYTGGFRTRILAAMRLNVRLARKYDASMILTSGARSHYDLRGPREMMALGMIMGMTQDEALHALSIVPQAIIGRNTDENRIMKGVEIVDVVQ